MITRDPEYPVEYSQLAAAFYRCADGHDMRAVLNASLQMVAASIGCIARSKGASLEQAEAYTRHVGDCILASVNENWQRESQPSDVVVKSS